MDFEPTPEQMIEQAGLTPAQDADANCVTLPNGECVAPGPCMHTPPETALDFAADALDGPAQIESPEGTRGWTHARKDGIETFTAPDATVYVRARSEEEADVIVSFTRIRGMTPMRLVRADASTTVKRAERKARREKRELQRRGYDV